MKRIWMMLSLVIVTMVAIAVPAKPGLWKTLRLADGTEVKAQLKGDEHGHFWLTEDGRAFTKISGSDFYQVADAHIIIERAKVRRQQMNVQRTRRLAPRRAGTRSNYTGTKKGIIILANFQDRTFQEEHTNEFYQRIANEVGFDEGYFQGSMADYFKAQSGGQFELDFDIVGPVTVSKSASYYGSNNSSGDDKYPAKMVKEAVTLAKEVITDWTPYDWDGDHYVDQVYVVYAGQGEADSDDEDAIWPHTWDLFSAGAGVVTVGKNLMVNTYACGSELNGSMIIEGIGTMCHEFSHCLGYPDFYDTDYSGGWGMDMWDLMDQGSYNGNGYQPAGYTSYERWLAGWSTPIELNDEDVNVTDMKSLQEGGEYYVIYNPNNRNEYYLLENRQFTGWDAGLPGSGLLILHVDYDEAVWTANEANDDPNHQRMTWVAADNKYQYRTYQGYKYLTWEGLKTDPYPSGDNNKFNKDTKPAAQFYNRKSTLSTNMTSSVEDIMQNKNGTISFRYVANYDNSGTGGDDPVVTPTGDCLFYESFDKCNGKGGNDGEWSGSGIAIGSFTPDNEGWEGMSKYGANQCIKLGTGKENGTVTTPSISFTANETVLAFKAAAWGDESTTLTISYEGSSLTINPDTVTLSNNEWTTHTIKITGTGASRIVLTPSNNRFFLDELQVVAPHTTTGMMPINAQHTTLNTQQYYTLDGRKLSVKPTQKGIYLVNGKKVVIK